MNDPVLTAIIAGGVSITASIITYVSARRQIRSQRETIERQLTHKFTERLYELRLSHYPLAFEITEPLGKLKSAQPDQLPARFGEILDRLKKWKSGEVNLVLSDYATDMFYTLERRLKRNPGNGKTYSEEQLDAIWDARQRFRGALRRDVGLLHSDEITSDSDAAAS
jgi:hypothetical protein